MKKRGSNDRETCQEEEEKKTFKNRMGEGGERVIGEYWVRYMFYKKDCMFSGMGRHKIPTDRIIISRLLPVLG